MSLVLGIALKALSHKRECKSWLDIWGDKLLLPSLLGYPFLMPLLSVVSVSLSLYRLQLLGMHPLLKEFRSGSRL